MLDIKYIREHADGVQKGVAAKGVKADINAILKLDGERRELQTVVDELRQQQKTFGANDIEAGKVNKAKLKEKEEQLNQVSVKAEAALKELPNLPKADVKVGNSEADNEIIRTVGKIPKFKFQPKDYLELAHQHDLIDMERAAKVSGSRFGYLKNEAALLEFALIQYGLEITRSKGFIPVVPPVLINEEAMEAMGYLEHGGKDETYHLVKDKLYLVGTAEQSIGPMHMNEVLTLNDMPRRYVGFSSCFRSEAGSYGKDTKGILRVHQFDKLEMVVFTTPQESDVELEKLLAIEEELMQGLKLP